MEEAYTKQYFQLCALNINKLIRIAEETGIRSKIWQEIKKSFIKNGLYLESDFLNVENYLDKDFFYSKGAAVPSFITDRSIKVSNTNFVSYENGTVYSIDYENKDNNTYYTNNGIIAYKDNEGIVRITPYSVETENYLVYLCNFKKNQSLHVPLSSGLEKLANEKLQKKWKEYLNVFDLFKNSLTNFSRYIDFEGKETYLLPIAYQTSLALEEILKGVDLNLNGDIIKNYDYKKIYNIINENANLRVNEIRLCQEARETARKMQETHENANLKTYQNWLDDTLAIIQENSSKLLNLNELSKYLSPEELANQINISFKPSKYIASSKDAIKCALKEGMNVQKDLRNLNNKLLNYGLSLIDLSPHSKIDSIDKFEDESKQTKKVIESKQIDNFLEHPIQYYFEDDLVMTNINRLIAVSNKLKKQEINEETDRILNSLFSQLTEYLNINYNEYKQQLELIGFDIPKQIEKINKKLKPLGLSFEDFQKNDIKIKESECRNIIEKESTPKNVYDKFKMNRTIELFFSKYFQVELNYSEDLLIDQLLKKVVTENFLLNEKKILEKEEIRRKTIGDNDWYYAEALNSYGENYWNFYKEAEMICKYLNKEISFSLTKEFKEDKIKSGQNWQEYETKINLLLSNLGMQVNDFFSEGLIKTTAEFNMNSLGVSADMFVEICKQMERKLLIEKLEKKFTENYNNFLGSYNELYENLLNSLGNKSEIINKKSK